MKLVKISSFAVVLMVVGCFSAYTQSLPVGTPGFEDFYRRAQLTGNIDSSLSFTVRPIFQNYVRKATNSSYPDFVELSKSLNYGNKVSYRENSGLEINILPFSVQSQFNSHHPTDWNDGAMIPAKGFQTVVSGGVFMKYGPLTVQLRPEILFAQNNDFETFAKGHFDVTFARYYDIYNNIDLPARFGNDVYGRFLLGQSSLRLNHKSFSVGLSNENLWWGPGIRNSLLMSNSAPGFKHITLNTIRPVKTPIGTFEGQLVAGRLENSGFAPLTPDHFYFGSNLYVPKPNDWRYLAGIVITWQPKWVPGLFLGFDKASQMYGKDLNKIGDYLPFFSTTSNVSSPDAPLGKKDELSSVFMRWLWTEEHAEIYFQYGIYNNKPDFTQAILAPNDSRAYIFGLRKMLPFNRARNESLMIGVEVTQLQHTSLDRIAKGGQWYVSKSIRQGYTHMGQLLGAGIGPGANSQTVTVSWLKGLKRIGLQMERYLHNNDFYYYTFTDSKDFRRHWVDLSYGVSGEWDFKNLVFNASFKRVNALNYQWYLKQNPGDDFFANRADANNFQILAGVTYRF